VNATLVRDVSADFRGKAFLYRCDPPMQYTDGYGDDADELETEYVIVSATHAMFSGPETYIFPANSDGEVTNWSELDGSYKGGLDHAGALRAAGYTVIETLSV
jgi:hypothetical protein